MRRQVVNERTDGQLAGSGSSRPGVLTLVLSATTLAVVLCLWGLGSRSLWFDEAISLNATTQLGETLSRTSATMGFYYVALTGWTKVFGTSAVAVRSMSVLFIAATVALMYPLARRLHGRRVALTATLLVALLPALTRYGQEARSYALTALLASASWYCLARAVTEKPTPERDQDRERRWWLAVTLLSVLGVLSHGLFILQVVVQGASLLAARWWDPLRRFLPALLASGLVGAVLFFGGANSVANWVPPLSMDQVITAGGLLIGPTWPVAVVAGGLVSMGLAASVARYRLASTPSERWKALVPGMWALGPLLGLTALSVVRPYLHARYLVASLPAIALLLASGLDLFHRRLIARSGRPVAWWSTAAAMVLMVSLLTGQLVYRSEPAEDWRSASRILAAQAEPGDRILFTQPDLKLAFDAAWSELSEVPHDPPEVVYPQRPLGELHRFDPPPDPDLVSRHIHGVHRVWVAHRTMTSSGDQLLHDVLSWPAMKEEFRTIDHHRLEDGVHLLLLTRSAN